MKKALKTLALSFLFKYLMLIAYLVGFVTLITMDNIWLFGLMAIVSLGCMLAMMYTEISFLLQVLKNKEE